MILLSPTTDCLSHLQLTTVVSSRKNPVQTPPSLSCFLPTRLWTLTRKKGDSQLSPTRLGPSSPIRIQSLFDPTSGPALTHSHLDSMTRNLRSVLSFCWRKWKCSRWTLRFEDSGTVEAPTRNIR